jgi:hypothetical protein
MEWALIAIIILLLTVAYELVKPVDKKWIFSRKAKLPPGPKGLPIVGNLLEFWTARSGGAMNSYVRRSKICTEQL